MSGLARQSSKIYDNDQPRTSLHHEKYTFGVEEMEWNFTNWLAKIFPLNYSLTSDKMMKIKIVYKIYYHVKYIQILIIFSTLLFGITLGPSSPGWSANTVASSFRADLRNLRLSLCMEPLRFKHNKLHLKLRAAHRTLEGLRAFIQHIPTTHDGKHVYVYIVTFLHQYFLDSIKFYIQVIQW